MTIKGASSKLKNAFEYSSTLDAHVISVASGPLSVTSGDTITINGSGLTSLTGDSVIVSVSGRDCTIINATSTQIICQSPTHTPGVKQLQVKVPGKGYAFFKTSRNVSYVLVVHSTSPDKGSILGGTVVTLTGEGFSSNMSDNQVMCGNKECALISSSNTEIKCLTADTGKIIKIDNSGEDKGKCVLLAMWF